jgi:hypothetical protein
LAAALDAHIAYMTHNAYIVGAYAIMFAFMAGELIQLFLRLRKLRKK